MSESLDITSNEEFADTLHPEVLEVLTELTGKLNGDVIHLTGEGMIDEAGGINEGVFTITDLPDDVDGRSLGAFLFTGYPNSCRITQPGVANPFVGGTYHYTRKYHFGNSGEVTTLKVTCELDKEHKRLTSKFELSGTIPKLSSVKGVSPIYEMWSPDGNELKGSFGVAWLDEKTGKVTRTATALSDYQPVNVRRLGAQPKYRYLKLDSKLVGKAKLFVRQTSELVNA